MAYVQLDPNSPWVLSLKAKAVDDIALSVFVQVLCPDDLIELHYLDPATQEERVYLICQTPSWTPCFDLKLMITRLERKSDESVSFNSVATPFINWVNLKQNVRSLPDWSAWDANLHFHWLSSPSPKIESLAEKRNGWHIVFLLILLLSQQPRRLLCSYESLIFWKKVN